MTPPTRLEDFAYREFHIYVAQVGKQILAIARDRKGKEVERVAGETLGEVRIDMKRRLNHLSQDFIGVEGAITLFKRAYPDGFKSAFYVHGERNYKDDTVRFLRDKLGKSEIDELLGRGEYEHVGALAKQALSKSNLCFPNEQMTFGDALKVKGLAEPFAKLLRELLYGDLDRSLEALARLLKPHGAAKWPILTFWPFFRFPERHMFLKPRMVQHCAERMGYDLHYEPLPNRDTYHSLRGFTDLIRKRIATLEPKDNIDIQTFMYVVSKEGYVQEAIDYREASEMTDSGSAERPLPV